MTETYLQQYLFVGCFALVVLVLIALAPIILARFIAPKKPSPSKNATYECGMESEGDSWIRYRVQFYIFALIFVIFDVETVFIYPWAISFKQLGGEALIAMLIFISLLFLGLAYEWRKKTLEWE